MPLFSIVIPSYNRAHLLKECVSAVLSQSLNDFELIVVDDGSKDETQALMETIIDPRVVYHRKQNEERAVARNTGIKMASGDYVTFLDSDDKIYPDHLEEATSLIAKAGSPDWMHLNYDIRDANGKVLKKAKHRTGDLGASLVTGNHLSCLGVFVRNDVIKKNLFDENPMLIGSEDYDLWLRLAQKYRLTYSNKVTASLIQHPVRSVLCFTVDSITERIDYLISKEERLNMLSEKSRKKFRAHRYMYLALHQAMKKNRSGGIRAFFKAIMFDSSILVTRKTLGFIKNLVI